MLELSETLDGDGPVYRTLQSPADEGSDSRGDALDRVIRAIFF
jgi:hypothetical protein